MAAPDNESRYGSPAFHWVAPASHGQLRVLRVGDVELQLDAHKVRVAGSTVHIPPRELQMLTILMNNAGRVVSRRQLLDLWGPGHPDDNNSIEVHINRLRRRVDTPGARQRIRTVRGTGYIFDLPDTDPADL